MAGCPSYGTSSQVSLWYCLDPDPAATMLDGSVVGNAVTWNNIPLTGETINTNLTATISNQITSNRSYANSKLTQGEVGGTISFEMSSNQFTRNMLISAMQCTADVNMGTDQVTGTSGVAINAAHATDDTSDRTIDLTGLTATVGATYTVIINDRNFVYVAVAGTSLSIIATALAAKLDAVTWMAATATGSVITISTGAGTAVITFDSFSLIAWAPNETMKNASKKTCYIFMKRILRADGTYDYYIFRGCQVGSLTMEFKTGALVTSTVKLMGVKPETPILSSAAPTYWYFRAAPLVPLFSSVDSMKYFYITRLDDRIDTEVVMQDLTVTLENNLFQQQAIGQASPFSAGLASGRFSATLSGSAYYDTPNVYLSFIGDIPLYVQFRLLDENTDGYDIIFPYCKVTGGGIPEASAPDESMMIKTELRAFETSGSQGTIRVVRKAF